MQEKELSFVDHLEELRWSILKSAVYIILATVVVCGYMDILMPIITRPVKHLVFLAPQEAIVAQLKVAFFCGLFIASPLVIYNVWLFISSGLTQEERKYIGLFGPVSFILFCVGVWFGYSVIVPVSISFLFSLASEYITPMISVSNYVSFIGTIILTFGLIFELPLVSLFLTKIKLVTPQFLAKQRRVAILVIFILAALLTPPDVVTQCLMAVPLVALYEIGILFSKLAYKKNK